MSNKSNFSFLNSEQVIANVNTLIGLYKKDVDIANEDRKSLLFDVLNDLQSSNIPFKSDGILIDFENQSLLEQLITDGMIDSEDTLNNQHLFSLEDQQIIRENIEKALQLINILHPGLHYLINQLIGTIVCFRKKGFGGGSVSSLVGCIWLNPLAKWSIVDYAESLYHEFIHNSLFLDDMLNSIFPDTQIITTEQAMITSTILKKKRPLDRSFHSACVAIGLMHFYYMMSDYNKVTTYLKPLRQTISEMNEKQNYMGERGITILEEMNKFSKLLDLDSITSTLSLNQHSLVANA